jgi:hypothetical protein
MQHPNLPMTFQLPCPARFIQLMAIPFCHSLDKVNISVTKALTNYHIRNGRAQNSLLFSLLCSAIDGFKL